ncbi:unnamed protein product [Pleuronectes platessa]|uniref:Uncharacterized protein n=1 Tax=Pleuronectes platessa TaxID=8262 RepID=A0A9N7YT06_PLEPL|nr:unnamed protein product [Pleuronectes platessa]
MPCWGARERLLFPPCAVETTISQYIALLCRPAHPSLSRAASSTSGSPSPGQGAHTPADQQRGAQSSLTFLLPAPAKRRCERKERGSEQRAALTGRCLMVLL